MDGPLVHLVQHHHGVSVKTSEHALPQEHAVREEHDRGLGATPMLETDMVADFASHLDVAMLSSNR